MSFGHLFGIGLNHHRCEHFVELLLTIILINSERIIEISVYESVKLYQVSFFEEITCIEWKGSSCCVDPTSLSVILKEVLDLCVSHMKLEFLIDILL